MKTKHRLRNLAGAVVLQFGLFAALATAPAQTIVTNLADSGPGTLRQVIANAGPGDTVMFDPALTGQTNVLTSGELPITKNLTIDASALPGGFKISGNQNLRVFELASNTVVTLNSLTIQDGYDAPTNGGGGIHVNSSVTLTLTNCTLCGNSASDDSNGYGGGGIYFSGGTLTINGSRFSGNQALGDASGGGIDIEGGTVTINDSTFSGNFATNGNGLGGAIFFDYGTLTINGSTFFGNSASYGGGIFCGSTNTINGSTFSGNSGGYGGGGIFVLSGPSTITGSTFSGNQASVGYDGYGGGGISLYQATATINNSTFSGNFATNGGGGIYVTFFSSLTLTNCTLSGNSGGGGGFSGGGGGIYIHSDSTLKLTSSVVAENTAPGLTKDVSGSFSGANNLMNGNPLLAPLGNYGGPTQTMPPLAGSPAIDAGLDSVSNFLATDQRGYPRLSGAHVDIGAVEAQWASPGSPPLLTSPARGANGAFSFGFNTASNTDFTVLATTNITLPLGQWSILGQAVQNVPGQYIFTDPGATNFPRRFYYVDSP